MSIDKAPAKTTIFLISYEFTFSTFSGNGILARSLVLSLLQQGCRVTVWCCGPPEEHDEDGNSKDHPIQVPEVSQEGLSRFKVLRTTISSRPKWHRLDADSAWNEFVCAGTNNAAEIEQAAKEASTVLAVDWTGHHAWKSIPLLANRTPPLVYLNFRVYSSGMKDPQQRLWYDEKERDAVQQADLIVALSTKDRASIVGLMQQQQKDTNKIHILVPPLRKDVERLAVQHANAKAATLTSIFWNHMPAEAAKALTTANGQARKCFVTCVVRLSPEKNTLRFVRFLAHAKTRAFFKAQNWIPLLAGSASDPEYARRVKTELAQVCGCVVLDSFLPPESLAAVFSCTVLNFHPCAYDAYGMTIMEAAAMGVPSILQAGDSVGATVHVGNGASIEVEMNDSPNEHDQDHLTDEAVERILERLHDTTALERIGEEARARSLAWDEAAYGKALLQLLEPLVQSN